MTFLPLSDEPAPSNVERALREHEPSRQAYAGLQRITDELVPYIGERAVSLFAYAIARGTGAQTPTAAYRKALIDGGETPEDPQVTETERLLLDWGAAIGADPSSVTDEMAGRLERAFSPKLRLLLVAFAGQVVAAAVFASAGRLPLDDDLRGYAIE